MAGRVREGMKRMNAIVTGASSGIGHAISEYLLSEGYEVFGIGRSMDERVGTLLASENFHAISLDLTDLCRAQEIIDRIQKENAIHLLVNNAGVGYYGMHEELSAKKLDEMVTINLTVPMLLSSLLMRNLKKNQGTIINISSYTAHETNTHGCAYGATKAGLSSFGKSLFFENRKYGVKVVNLEPEMTRTDLYRNADFTASEEVNASLFTQDIVEAVAYVLAQKEHVAVHTVSLTPQYHRIQKK